MKQKQKTSVFAFLARRILIIVLVLWLLCMSLLTWMVARDFYLQLESGVETWATVGYSGKDSVKSQFLSLFYSHWMDVEPLLPVVLPQKPDSYGSDDWFWGKWELMYGFQGAISISSTETGLTMRSGDCLIFSHEGSFAYVDLEELGGGKEFADRHIIDSPNFFRHVLWFCDRISLTGYFEGRRFYPVSLRYYQEHAGWQEEFFSAPDPSRETVTFSPDSPIWGMHYEPGAPFRWKGKTYENAAALLDEENLQTGFDLFGGVIRSGTQGTRTVDAVIYCKPLEYALLRTCHLWLITGAAVAVYLVWCLKRIKFSLTDPIKTINWAYEDDDSTLSVFGRSPLRELDALGAHFDAAQQDRHEAKNRAQQLQTALDYAKEAEENRRRLVSAMAHELKTPLAVVHSYAEGLQAGIAGEKQAQYLQVLLEESEKMDAMVQEMLDYSRLEAGKVQLATEDFSLSEAAARVFERLELAAKERELTVTFEQMQEFSVRADPGRIRQVITNLATNAIKYTTHGGQIRVRVFRHRGYGHMQVENDCQPLSGEALQHVWDSFYRADSARSGGGTGLGLSIVKSIVSLHRGSCSAKNVPGGVQFSFRIPM